MDIGKPRNGIHILFSNRLYPQLYINIHAGSLTYAYNSYYANTKDYKRGLIDRTTFKKIYDDQCDYFSYEKKKWLNDKDRKLLEKKEAELRDKRFASRRNKKVRRDL